jgi:hypothetical protein
LLEFFEKVTSVVDEGGVMAVTFLPRSTVPHKRLAVKLKAHGVKGKVLNWITN